MPKADLVGFLKNSAGVPPTIESFRSGGNGLPQLPVLDFRVGFSRGWCRRRAFFDELVGEG